MLREKIVEACLAALSCKLPKEAWLRVIFLCVPAHEWAKLAQRIS